MKKWFLALVALLVVVLGVSPRARQSFTQQVQALASAIGYTSSTSQFAQYVKSVVYPTSAYVNFGGVFGSGGYGIRDNAGTMQFRNSVGSWVAIPATGGVNANAKFILQQPDGTMPNAQSLSALATGIVLNTTTTGVLTTSLLLPATNFPALVGDVTSPGGSLTTTIANAVVTLAKIANAAASSRILCAGSSGSGASYSECTLGSGLSIAGTVISSTAAAACSTATGDIQYYNGSGGFGCSNNLVWTNGSSLLTITGTTKTTSFLAGNNTPSLTSPTNVAAAINQAYSGAIGSAQDDAMSVVNAWTPSGSVSGQSEALLVQAFPHGAQNFTNDLYGIQSLVQSDSSATVSKLEGLRSRVSQAGNNGTVSTGVGVGAVVHVDHGTMTLGENFRAYSPEVGTSGAMTGGVQYYADDPIGSGCSACISQHLDFGSRGSFTVAPSPAASNAAGAAWANVQLHTTLSEVDTGTGHSSSDIDLTNSNFTPSADATIGGFLVGLNQNKNIIASHNLSDTAVIGVNGEVETVSGAGNLTSHQSQGLVGVSAEWDVYGSGLVANADAIVTNVGQGGGGTITNGTSIHLFAPYDTSSIVTNYTGILIENQTWPGSTTNFAINYLAPAGKNFSVLANGDVTLAGLRYTFPSTPPTAGQVLAFTSGVSPYALAWTSGVPFPVFAPAGTSSAPSYSWSTAHGVGLYEPSTNQTGIVGGVILGKTASAANGSILYVSGTGIAATGGNPLLEINLNPGFDSSPTIPTGQNASGLIVSPVLTTFSSGTHALIANVNLSAGTWTAGGAIVTEGTTLYIAGAPTIGVSKYAIHVAAGYSRFDGGSGEQVLTVGTLPGSPVSGQRAAVSDANSPTIGSAVSGGGAAFAAVMYNGSQWTVYSK